MKTSPVKCNRPLLRQSLEDGLTEQQEEWLVAHLDDCVSCQQALTSLAADSEGWSQVEHVLRDEISGTHPVARGVVSTLVPGNHSSSFGHSRSARLTLLSIFLSRQAKQTPSAGSMTSRFDPSLVRAAMASC
ncbi:MAG: hypothetical protein ABGZ23_00365 [Fuerstiella sp.]